MKRNLFEELTNGIDALEKARQGKITLHQQTASLGEIPPLTSIELVELRQKLKLSQAVFAGCLGINKRTLENWEQGRARPNTQAALLIRLLARYPDTLEKLKTIT